MATHQPCRYCHFHLYISILLTLFLLSLVAARRNSKNLNQGSRRFEDYHLREINSPETVSNNPIPTVHESTSQVESRESAILCPLTGDVKSNVITDLINLITTSLANFSVNDAIAIGVFIIAIIGVKAVVIGILVWVWVAAYGHAGESEGYGGYGGYEAPAQISYGSPPVMYGTPANSYASPSAAYGKPSTSYGTASISYGTPSQTYGTPSQTYGTTSNSYGTPSQTYGTPSTAYSKSRGIKSTFDELADMVLNAVSTFARVEEKQTKEPTKSS